MKKFALSICLLLIAATLTNCSSVKVLDTWKSDTISELDNNFLVIARTSNNKRVLLLKVKLQIKCELQVKKLQKAILNFLK